MQKKKIGLVSLSFAVILTGMWYFSPVRQNVLLPVVKIMEATTCDITLSVYFRGTVYDENMHSLYLGEAACIDTIYVSIGERVKKGDVLLRASTGDAYRHVLPSIGDGVISVFNEITNSTSGSVEAIYCFAENDAMIIRSPIDGIVTELPVKEGGILAVGALCASVADPENLSVRAAVPEIYVQDIEAGMECAITGDAFRGESYTGVIELIMPYAKTTTSLTGSGDTVVDVLIRIIDPNEALRAGYNARVEIFTEKRQDAVVVPYEAIHQDNQNREYVLIYEGKTVKKQYVETGAELNDTVEILSGLEVGEQVVVENGEKLADGAAVKVVFG